MTTIPSRFLKLNSETVSIGLVIRPSPFCTATVIVLLGTSFRLVRTATTDLPAFARKTATGKPTAPEQTINTVSFLTTKSLHPSIPNQLPQTAPNNPHPPT